MGRDDAKFVGLHLVDFEVVVQHRIGHGKLAFFAVIHWHVEVYEYDFEDQTQVDLSGMN